MKFYKTRNPPGLSAFRSPHPSETVRHPFGLLDTGLLRVAQAQKNSPDEIVRNPSVKHTKCVLCFAEMNHQ